MAIAQHNPHDGMAHFRNAAGRCLWCDDITPTTRPSCEKLLWIGGAQRACGQRIGVTRWHDETGTEHVGCFRHGEALRHRYPVADPPEPRWLHDEQPDAIDEAKRYADWQESELREAFGG